MLNENWDFDISNDIVSWHVTWTEVRCDLWAYIRHKTLRMKESKELFCSLALRFYLKYNNYLMTLWHWIRWHRNTTMMLSHETCNEQWYMMMYDETYRDKRNKASLSVLCELLVLIEYWTCYLRSMWWC